MARSCSWIPKENFKIKDPFMQFALEGVILEYSFVKHSQGILGIKDIQITTKT